MTRPLHTIGLVDSPSGHYRDGELVVTPELKAEGWGPWIARQIAAAPRTADIVLHMPEAAIKGREYAGRDYFDAPEEAREYLSSEGFAQVVDERRVWLYLGQPNDWSVRGLAALVLPWVAATGVRRFVIDASSSRYPALDQFMLAFQSIELMAEAFPRTQSDLVPWTGAAYMTLKAASAGLANWSAKGMGPRHLIVEHNDTLTAEQAADLTARGFVLGSHGVGGAKVLRAALGPEHAPPPDDDPILPPVLPPPAPDPFDGDATHVALFTIFDILRTSKDSTTADAARMGIEEYMRRRGTPYIGRGESVPISKAPPPEDDK